MSDIARYKVKDSPVVEAIEWRPEHKDEIKRWVDFDKVQFDWIGTTPRIQIYNVARSKWNISDHRTWFVVKDSAGNFSLMEEQDFDKEYEELSY